MQQKSKKTRVLILVLLSIVLLGAIVWVVTSSLSQQEAALPVVTPRPTAKVIVREKEVEKIVRTEKVITAETIQDGLRDMGFLLTEEYYFTEVVSYSSIKKFVIEWSFTESSYLASYDGVVAAGIDCSRITVEKDDENKTILISVPKAQARPADIDPNSLVVYSEKEGAGNHISIEDYNNSLIELEKAAEKKAVERGVLDRANANAERMIRSFVGSLVDLSSYTLTIQTLP